MQNTASLLLTVDVEIDGDPLDVEIVALAGRSSGTTSTPTAICRSSRGLVLMTVSGVPGGVG